jgi:hypothetical protein
MSWNIQTPGDYINGPLTVVGAATFNSNVGIGVAPSVWNSNYNALDVGQNGSIAGRVGASNTVDVVSNGFRNSAGNWVYKLATSNPASRYQLDGSTGNHYWYTGAAGTAGNTITGFSNALMTLDYLGRFSVGGSPSGNTLVSVGSLSSVSAVQNGYQILTATGVFSIVTDGSTNSAGTTINYSWNNGGQGPLIFSRAAGEVARFNPGGTFILGGGNTAADGRGIAFPAAQSASTDANTLDDYEEGIFTPTVGGTWTANPSSMTGTYTKVGRLVTIQILFNGLATKASATSGWIDGLPFNVVSTGTGAVCDSNVSNVGLCFAANSTRVWLTANSFSPGANYLSLTYTV